MELPWLFMAQVTAVAVGGILAGTALVRFVPHRALQRAFAAFLIAIGTWVLHANRDAVIHPAAAAAAEDARP